MRINMKLLGICLLSASMLGSCVHNESVTNPESNSSSQNINGTMVESAPKIISSEDLLFTDDSKELVELGSAYDPAEAHINARKKVNIKRRSKKDELSAHFEPNAKSGEDGKLRILRLSGQAQDLEIVEELEKEQPSEAVGKVGVIKALFKAGAKPEVRVESKPEAASIVIPKIKPYVAMKKHANSVKARKLSENYVVPNKKPLIGTSRGKAVYSGVPASVVKLRSGVYKGKTRVVIELSSVPEYAAVIDKLRNVLSVSIENTRWDIDKHNSLKITPLLGSYVARERDDGSVILEIRLKESAEIVNVMVLPPNKSSKHRIVIDLQ